MGYCLARPSFRAKVSPIVRAIAQIVVPADVNSAVFTQLAQKGTDHFFFCQGVALSKSRIPDNDHLGKPSASPRGKRRGELPRSDHNKNTCETKGSPSPYPSRRREEGRVLGLFQSFSGFIHSALSTNASCANGTGGWETQSGSNSSLIFKSHS